jgi:hypothetical protein
MNPIPPSHIQYVSAKFDLPAVDSRSRNQRYPFTRRILLSRNFKIEKGNSNGTRNSEMV